MTKLMKLFVASLLISSSLLAHVTAHKVDFSLANISATSSAWHHAEFSEVAVYPQTTIKMNDKKAVELNKNNGAKVAKVGALYNETEIAFLVRWKDKTLSIQKGYRTDSFGDAFAVQFASDYSDYKKLPYIGMGSAGREVVVHVQKAAPHIHEPNGNGNVAIQVGRKNTNLFHEDLAKFDAEVKKVGVVDYERTFVSAGFRSMTEIKDDSVKSNMNMMYNPAHKCWKGVLSRELKDEYLDLNSHVIPVAFAIWDGAKDNRDGLKLLSGWTAVKLEGNENNKDASKILCKSLSPKSLSGDAKNGKEQFAMNCAGCHIANENNFAPKFMAPNLNNIGGYASASYIKESIVDPSAVVVPGYNRNAHKNTPWYNVENGKRVSTMPSYSWLDEKTLNDIVYYMKTELKAEAK
jgi:complex iron-sulfur molybdoenzyme family reductase subunit gamma